MHWAQGLTLKWWRSQGPAECPQSRKHRQGQELDVQKAGNQPPGMGRPLGTELGTAAMCPPTTGKNPTDEYLEGMMSEAPGPINFTMFLTMFGEKLNGTDPEDVIRNAFACFDEEASGQCTLEAWAGQGPWRHSVLPEKGPGITVRKSQGHAFPEAFHSDYPCQPRTPCFKPPRNRPQLLSQPVLPSPSQCHSRPNHCRQPSVNSSLWTPPKPSQPCPFSSSDWRPE